MAQPLDEALAQVRAAVLDEAGLVRAVGSGRRRGAQPAWRRVELRYVDLKAGRRLQLTSYDERQAHTRNVTPGEQAAETVEALLAEPFGNWHVETAEHTMQLRVTKKRDALVHTSRRHPHPTADAQQLTRGHDRRKQRLLEPGEPVLHLIGITDHTGTVKPTMQAKYRQVEEFLRALDAAVEAGWRAGALARPTVERPLRLVDLGCGNAYLSFAAYAYLHGARALPVRLVGVDVKTQSRRHNTELVEQLGWDQRVSFVEGSISAAELDERPDVVLALHACDTATDEALARALGWEAPVVMAAPCCHHDLQAQLRGSPTPAPFGLLTQHGILRERMADLLTDTFRAAILRQHGYRVEVMQFVDSRHTPRNVLLRGVRTGAAPSQETQREYDDLLATWDVRPALARILDS